MAGHPDICRYFAEGAKDEVYSLLLQLHNEQAILTGVPDAVPRLESLRERLNEIDPYYRYELTTVTGKANKWPSDVVFSVRQGDVRVDAYPKYCGAVKDRPVYPSGPRSQLALKTCRFWNRWVTVWGPRFPIA